MSRAERLLDLIQVLRGHRRPAPGRMLADELGISLRTVVGQFRVGFVRRRRPDPPRRP